MALHCSVFIATSLDGFIARPDGSIDWLPSPTDPGEDYGYADFMATVDVLVMGRNTFEMARSFSQWPYGERKVYVLSSGYPEAGESLGQTVTGTSAGPRNLVERLSAEGFMHAYVDGGKTIQSFLRAGLINDMTITRIPVLLGEGIPLFDSTGGDVSLRHVATKSSLNGLVQSRYEVLTAP